MLFKSEVTASPPGSTAPERHSSDQPRYFRLRHKLTALMMSVTLFILLLCAGGFALVSWQTAKQSLIRELYTIANISADNSTAALAFGDRDDAQEVLNALGQQPNIESAVLYDNDGLVLAQYSREGAALEIPLQIPKETGHQLYPGHIEVHWHVVKDNRHLGTLYLRSTTERLWTGFKEALVLVAILLGACALAALFLSSVMQRWITQPVDRLLQTVMAVSARKDYQLRASRVSNDELGMLVDKFNEMLEQIELRDTRLVSAQEQLAVKVTELKEHVAQRRRAEAEIIKQKQALERVNVKLLASNRELDEFAHVASHDLQEPLRKIQTFSERLKVKFTDALPERAREYLDVMDDAAKRMRVLIEDLLSLSRVLTRGQPFEEVDLNTVLERVITDLELKIQETNAQITVEGLPRIQGDASQLYRLFLNLVGNALKYRREDVSPVVEVRQEPPAKEVIDKGLVRIVVADNGIGFEQEYRDLIFKPFQRLHGPDEYSGTGIGLAICAKIVERHGGTISATSAVDSGSVFTVELATHQRDESETSL